MNYDYSKDGITYTNSDDEVIWLTNFTALVTEEIQYVDGRDSATILTIEGRHRDGNKLEPIQVPADKFPSMTWILQHWGIGPTISPTANASRFLQAAIQYESKPKRKTIYTHTGWTEIKGKDCYITATGAITPDGHDPSIAVELPTDLSRFEITPDPKKLRDAITATLMLSELGPPEMMWPLIAATFRPPIGEVDYAIHISGQTGTFKTEISSLMQSHYGSRMDARHLPGSWSSTGNALEAQAFRCKNAIFCVDDYVPGGSSSQMKALERVAEQLIRAQGNQQGRARLTDVSSHQQTMYPRGMILSTGEDIPRNHSIRARLAIIDLTPGNIDRSLLSIAQKNRGLYPIGMAGWIQWIATHGRVDIYNRFIERRDMIRDQNPDVGHSRTPALLGDLQTTITLFMAFAKYVKAVDQKGHDALLKIATDAIMKCCLDQERHLKNADPCETFIDIIRGMLGSHLCHLKTLDGGIPAMATDVGWTIKEDSDVSALKTYVKHGPTLGWINTETNELLLDAATSWALIMKAARGQLTATKTTMMKRLKDQGILVRTDETRQRNTVRVTCEGQSRNVLALSLLHVLDTQESKE